MKPQNNTNRPQRLIIAACALVCASLIASTPAIAQKEKGGDGKARAFTRSHEGRSFGNGVTLRKSAPLADRSVGRFFPGGHASFPHYYASPRGVLGVDFVFSPFGFYAGIFPTYISRSCVIIAAPPVIYIDPPVYVHHTYVVYADDNYYLHRKTVDNEWRSDPELKSAVYDIENAFRNDDIALLAKYVDANGKIAIFTKGAYEYSVATNDYLDMTRDFMRGDHTIGYDIYKVHAKANGVNQLYAKHTYKDADGKTHTVYLCMVAERAGDKWVITQVDTAPDQIDN